MIDPKRVIDQVLEASEADEAIVIVAREYTVNLRWANSGLTTNGNEHQTQIVVISVIDKRVGKIVSSLNKAVNPKQLAKQSELAARQSPGAEDYTPVVKGSGKWPKGQSAKMDEPDGLAEELGQVFKRAKNNDWLVFGYTELSRTDYWLATSAGARRYHSSTQGQLELNAKSYDYKKSVWAGMPLKSFADADVPGLYATLEKKMEWSEKSIDLKPGKYEVLLEPAATADMLLYAYVDSSARRAEEGRSAYSYKDGTVIGRKLYGQDVSIYSDPKEPGLESEPFAVSRRSGDEESVFDNGYQLKKTHWIKDGVQKHLLAPRYLAKKYSYTRPAPFIPNLIFKSISKSRAKSPSLEDMIRGTKDGLLITCFWYMREVDPQSLLLTGLTRDGIFLIKDGEVKGAVNNFRFNMSPLDMLKQIKEIGASEHTLAREFGDYFPLTHMPVLRIKDFNFSSVSQAT